MSGRDEKDDEKADAPSKSADAPPRKRGKREPPTRIGRYDVKRLLGQGGMGRVWLARDTVLERQVAVKVLRDDLALPPAVRDELLTRMRHEARAAAAVSHPNIVTLHDMGEDPATGLYLVFEYVPGPQAPRPSRSGPPAETATLDGARSASEPGSSVTVTEAVGEDGPESLRDRLRFGRMPLADVARLARELGSAIAFAHEAGVIHRDIKPENILFSRTGAKMADFGIARIPESTITRQNTVLGTPAYTAPEALSRGEFGPASDQFSLAASLYEAATGVRAFGSDDPLVTVSRVSNEAPEPLDGSIGSPAIVKALTRAFERGLAKDPSQRFPSAADLGDTVARAIEWPPLSDAPLIRNSIDPLSTARIGGPPDSSWAGATNERIEIEIERTPLSSRSLVAAKTSERPSTPGETLREVLRGDTPSRMSMVARQRTNRLQNIFVAGALLVIVGLVVFGRKTRDDGASLRDAAQAFASVAGPAPANAAPPARSATTATPRAHGTARSSLAPGLDAGSAPALGTTPSEEHAPEASGASDGGATDASVRSPHDD